MRAGHVPVLLRAACEPLLLRAARVSVATRPVLVDATFGRGGHSAYLLEHSAASRAVVVALDRDADAVASPEAAQLRAAYGDERLCLVHGRFGRLGVHVRGAVSRATGVDAVAPGGFADGILADLGVSSPQLDEAHRGFSFRYADAELDMRMDRSGRVTAASIVNKASEDELLRILRVTHASAAMQPCARRIARTIVAQRPLRTVGELNSVVRAAIGPFAHMFKHDLSTRTFLALRLAVNSEIEELEALFREALRALRPGGVLVVIAFHSLEFAAIQRAAAYKAGAASRQSAAFTGTGRRWHLLDIVSPDADEMRANPRARSAKAFVFEAASGSSS